MNQGPRQPGEPIRVLFQELTPGTARKARAQSADAPTGGGARDIRVRPHDDVREFMAQLFPRERVINRPARGGAPGERITIRLGAATWDDGREEVELEYWPPTNARPREGRIAKINSLPPLADPPTDSAGVVVLFVQDDAGVLWVRYATVDELAGSVPEVRDRILQCLENSPDGHIATGYIDRSEDPPRYWCRGELDGDPQ